MNVSRALQELVCINLDLEWIQMLDYEHIPFRCCKCHEHDHLFKDCPHNVETTQGKAEDAIDREGFTKVPSKCKLGKKPTKHTLTNQGKETNNV